METNMQQQKNPEVNCAERGGGSFLTLMKVEIDLKGNLLSKTWGELSTLLEKYKAELITAEAKYTSACSASFQMPLGSIQELKEQLMRKDEMLTKCQAEMIRTQSLLGEVRTDLTGKEELLQKLQKELIEKDGIILQLQAEVLKLNAELSGKNTLVDKLQEQMIKESLDLASEMNTMRELLDKERNLDLQFRVPNSFLKTNEYCCPNTEASMAIQIDSTDQNSLQNKRQFLNQEPGNQDLPHSSLSTQGQADPYFPCGKKFPPELQNLQTLSNSASALARLETDLSRTTASGIDLAALFSPLLPFDGTGVLSTVPHDFSVANLPIDTCPSTLEETSKEEPALPSFSTKLQRTTAATAAPPLPPPVPAVPSSTATQPTPSASKAAATTESPTTPSISTIKEETKPFASCSLKDTDDSETKIKSEFSPVIAEQLSRLSKLQNFPQNSNKPFWAQKPLCSLLAVKKPGKYKCDICGKLFSQTSTLKIHKRLHTGEKPYECQHCGKRFTHNQNCKNHMRIHTGEKPFVCETCGSSFSRHYALTTHMRIHTGAKPYQCALCGRGFAVHTNWKTHMRIHTGEKPFTCHVCGSTYAHLQTLKKHRLLHKGDIVEKKVKVSSDDESKMSMDVSEEKDMLIVDIQQHDL